MSAPRKGQEVRKIVAIRLEPSEKELLKKHFGGVQAAVDSVLKKLKNKNDPLLNAIKTIKKASKQRNKKSNDFKI